MKNKEDVTLYDVLKTIENVHAEVQGARSELRDFRKETKVRDQVHA